MRKKKRYLIYSLCFVMLFLLLVLGIINAKAGTGDQAYSIGSNGTIQYKESENKIYYTRKHYSSGSGIRYYTRYFAISLKEASVSDDLSRLDEKADDLGMLLLVSSDGKGLSVGETDKTKDFYWYDSEPDDDGYITTTYVIDGKMFLSFLDNADKVGKHGDIYIHHIFAVTGGSDSDDWHVSNGVVNDTPYYLYSELMNISWNNTEATHGSQMDCLNIPVPFKKSCSVNTAYYDEYGNIVRQENLSISDRNLWEKTVPYIIEGNGGEWYTTVEPGSIRDTDQNVMKAFFIWNTDPNLKGIFPAWNAGQDMDLINGNTVKTKNAADSQSLPGGYRTGADNVYVFDMEGIDVIDVILYIPVIKYKEAVPVKVLLGYYDADTLQVIESVKEKGDAITGSGFSLDVSEPEGYEIVTKGIFGVYGNKEAMTLMKKPENAMQMEKKQQVQYRSINRRVTVQKVPECENIVIWVSVKEKSDNGNEGPEIPDPEEDQDEIVLNPNVTVKYFAYDKNKNDYIWLKSELKYNEKDITGKFRYSSDCALTLTRYLNSENGLMQVDYLAGILYGDDKTVLESGTQDFFKIYENGENPLIFGTAPGILKSGEKDTVEFETLDNGKYYTVFIYCREADTENALTVRYFDFESGDIIGEKIDTRFFKNSTVKWHGINGKLVWALPVSGDAVVTELNCGDKKYIPVYLNSEYETMHTGQCSSEECKHTYYGFGTGNIDSYYCMTCGKLKRSIYYMNNQWEPDAKINYYDNGTSTDVYHTYTDFGLYTGKSLRASFLYGQHQQGDESYEASYNNAMDMMFGYDRESDIVWIRISGDPEYGDDIISVYPEKESGISTGIIYIPCYATDNVTPISVTVINDNLKYVQRIDADPDMEHIVVGESDSYGSKGHEYDSCDFSLYIEGYSDNVRISFPFDVYTGDGLRIKADSWNRLYPDYHVPGDVQEGIYTVRAAVFSEKGELLTEADTNVMISGKMYGFELINVNTFFEDYLDVFLKEGEIKNLYPEKYAEGIFDDEFDTDKRYHYGSGVKNELGLEKTDINGRVLSERYILPLMDGSSVRNPETGMLKSGYTWTYKVITEGSLMAENGAFVTAIPTFFWESFEGGERKEVDIWYSGAVDGKNQYFVKTEKAELTFSSNVINTGTKRTWLLEYRLPDVWYCTLKGFDLEEYIEKTGGCSFEEDFFLKEGYIMINFEICAYGSDSSRVMTYSNIKENVSAGMCDMWEMEGFAGERTDIKGRRFKLEKGDVILLRIPGSTYDPGTGRYDPPSNISEENMVIRKNPDYYNLNPDL